MEVKGLWKVVVLAMLYVSIMNQVKPDPTVATVYAYLGLVIGFMAILFGK